MLEKIIRLRQFIFKYILNQINPHYNKIIYIYPEYWIIDVLNKDSNIVDIGAGDNANFSTNLINKYKLHSQVFEPTKRHHKNLENIQKIYSKNIVLNKFALFHKNKSIIFNETLDNISGSLLNSHKNIIHDRTKQYYVKGITLSSIIKKSKVKIDLIKIDVEGEEYKVIENIIANDLLHINQILIEFHHNIVKEYSIENTKKAVNKIKSLGYNTFCLDGRNYLFYRSKILTS